MKLIRKLSLILLCGLFNIPSYSVPSEQSCLAEAVYREASGETLEGKYAVAAVTLNRTKSPKFPNTICKVVFQPGQYSWATNSVKFKAPAQYHAIAKEALNGDAPNIDALYFHNIHVKPTWAKKKKFVSQIGRHLFYTDK